MISKEDDRHAAVFQGTSNPIGQQPPTLAEGGQLEGIYGTHAGAQNTHGARVDMISPGAAAGVNVNPNENGICKAIHGPGQDTPGGPQSSSDGEDLFADSSEEE